MRHLIIKFLLRLLSENQTFEGIDDRKIENWLATQYQHMGFREFVKKRDLTILKTLGMGVEGKAHNMLCGQRLELLRLLKSAEQAHKKLERKVGSNQKKK